MCLTLVLFKSIVVIIVMFRFFFQGMETMIVRYNSIVTSVKKKGYDLLDHRKGEVRVTFFQLPFYPVMLHVTYCAFKIFLLVWHWLWRIQTEHWWTETAAADVCWLLVWETVVCEYSPSYYVNFGKCSIDAVGYALLRCCLGGLKVKIFFWLQKWKKV